MIIERAVKSDELQNKSKKGEKRTERAIQKGVCERRVFSIYECMSQELSTPSLDIAWRGERGLSE